MTIINQFLLSYCWIFSINFPSNNHTSILQQLAVIIKKRWWPIQWNVSSCSQPCYSRPWASLSGSRKTLPWLLKSVSKVLEPCSFALMTTIVTENSTRTIVHWLTASRYLHRRWEYRRVCSIFESYQPLCRCCRWSTSTRSTRNCEWDLWNPFVNQ